MKFICIFSSRKEFQLIYMTRFKLQLTVNKATGEKETKEKDIFYEISHDKTKMMMRCKLFTDPLDSVLDFEFDQKSYQGSNLGVLMKLFRGKIDTAVKTIMSRILTVHYIHKKSIECKEIFFFENVRIFFWEENFKAKKKNFLVNFFLIKKNF